MKKIWLSTLLKFYAYVMVVILTIMGLVVAGISWKNQQAEADRIAQRVLTEVVTDLETSYQRVTQEGRSLVENPAKLEGVYRYFTLSPSEYETWRLNAQFPSYIQLSLHKNIDSLYLSNKNIEGIDVTLSDYKTVFVSTRQSKGGKQVSADHYKAPATAIPVPLTDPTTGAGIGIAYMIRIQIMRYRDLEYNLASQTLGTPTFKIIVKNIMPQLVSVIVSTMTLMLPSFISYEAFLSFFGLGLPVTVPSLGRLISDYSQNVTTNAYLFWIPLTTLILVSLSLFVVGQNLADASDPRTHR